MREWHPLSIGESMGSLSNASLINITNVSYRRESVSYYREIEKDKDKTIFF